MAAIKEFYRDFSFRYNTSGTGRFVLEYQSLDGFGHTVAKLTHFEGATLEDLLRKSADAHSQAAAAVERLQHKLSNLEVNQEKVKHNEQFNGSKTASD